MHIKVDEDLPQAIAETLRRHGYSCSTVSEQGMGGFKDPALWETVQAHHQFLITADKGFGDVRRYPPGTHGASLGVLSTEEITVLIQESYALVAQKLPKKTREKLGITGGILST